MKKYMSVDVEAVYNGKQAVDLVRQRRADPFRCILMDIDMPVMNGIEATLKIKELLPDQIIIGITAANEERFEGIEGFAKILLKPVEINQLKKTISYFCEDDWLPNINYKLLFQLKYYFFVKIMADKLF